MINTHRFTVKVSGESGQGVNSIGEIVAKSLKESGFYNFAYREYPSLIKGGYACHQNDFSDQPLASSSTHTDLLMCMSRVSFHAYLKTVRANGQVVHMLRQLVLTPEEQTYVTDNNINIAYIPGETIALEAGGKAIMANIVLLGVMWQLLGLPMEPLERMIAAEFAKKPQYIEPNLACLRQGHTFSVADQGLKPVSLPFQPQPGRENDALLSGNQLVSLGAIAAGVRAYYAYPMTPSSSILSYLSTLYHETGMVVKQIEDEISVAQMAIGSMFVGTRALVGTSGGGFDLMTESLTMSAMTETPFVCIIGQRPGPATGLPTWTAAGDLNLAVYAGHGEYTRLVLACSDPESAYLLIQKAFNLAEKYQIPVLVLTEKQIGESLFQMAALPPDEPIERHLPSADEIAHFTSKDRYKITDSGVSPRWFPGQSDAVYDANSDEHTEDGSLTEEAGPSQAMYDKRLRKQQTLLAELPEPVTYGPDQASICLVGWGSVKNTVLDVLKVWNAANSDHQVKYLHYEYVYPLRTQTFTDLTQAGARMILIENNAFGQLGALLTQHTGYQFTERFLKYDGRPFFVEDVMTFLEQKVGA